MFQSRGLGMRIAPSSTYKRYLMKVPVRGIGMRTAPSSNCRRYLMRYPTSRRSATLTGTAAGLPSGAVAAVGGRLSTDMSPRGRNITSGLMLRKPIRRTNCAARRSL